MSDVLKLGDGISEAHDVELRIRNPIEFTPLSLDMAYLSGTVVYGVDACAVIVALLDTSSKCRYILQNLSTWSLKIGIRAESELDASC